jgi:integrase
MSSKDVAVLAPQNHWHLLPGEQLHNVRVSTKSNWYSPVWWIDNPTPGTPKDVSCIPWDFMLPDGSRFTDAKHAALLDSFRRVVWSLLVDPRDGKAWKPSTLGSFGIGMRTMVRWMIANGYRELSALDGAASAEFLEDLPRILGRGAVGGERMREQDKEPDAKELTHAAIHMRIRVWAQIFRQGAVLVDAGLTPMPESPFDGVDPRTVANRMMPLVVEQIPPLPDEVVLPVLREATRWLDKAEEIIESQARYFADKANPTGIIGERQRGQVRNEFDRLADACIILVQALTGMRIGEICGLLGGWDEQAGLPICVIKRPSKTGLNELFYLCGELAKTRATAEGVEWLLGSRPRDSDVLPLPVRALIALERLMAPWRALCQADRLIVRFRQARGVLPLKSLDDETSGAALTVALGPRLNRTMRYFIAAEVDLSGLPDTNAKGEDLQVYRESRGHCIRTHQWRKTFAHYVLLTRPSRSMLVSVSQHFKHLSLAMTEEGYVVKDPFLRHAMEATSSASAVEFFMEAGRGKALTGRMGDLIAQHHDELQRMIDGDPDASYKRVEQWVRMHDIRIFFTEHGKCAIALNPTEARCHDVAGTTSLFNKAPNFEARHPGLCAGCALYIVDADHSNFWRERYIENTILYEDAKRGGLGQQYRVADERARQAAAMLRHLDIEVPKLEFTDAR